MGSPAYYQAPCQIDTEGAVFAFVFDYVVTLWVTAWGCTMQ